MDGWTDGQTDGWMDGLAVPATLYNYRLGYLGFINKFKLLLNLHIYTANKN